MAGVLAMIAGSGDLPVDLAARMAADGKPYFVLRLKGLADPRLKDHPGADVSLGCFGAGMRLLHQAGVDRLFFIGKVARPSFPFAIDFKGVAVVARLLMGAWHGDDAIQRGITRIFEAEGFAVVGPGALWPDMLMPAGLVAGREPTEADRADIAAAATAALHVGRRDRGQGAIARHGEILGAEDRAHTDQMLRAAAAKPGQGGVLVKLAKPQQDRRLDLPVVGPATIAEAAAARLGGVVIEAGGALLVRRQETIDAAEQAGLFLYGLDPSEIPQ